MSAQFTLRTIFLTTAFVAIATAGAIATRKAPASTPMIFLWELSFLATGAPIWVSAVFAAYAFGRRQITLWLVISFAIAEALAVLASHFCWDYLV